MKRSLVVIALLFMLVFASAAETKSWSLYTKSSLYQVSVTQEGSVQMTYFGSRSQDPSQVRKSWKEEIPVRSGYSTYTPVIEAVFEDGVRDIELTFVDARYIVIDGDSALAITQKDKYYPLTVIEYFRVHAAYDLIEKWIELKNSGKKGTIHLENVQSGSIFLPKDEYDLKHLSGSWGQEFAPQETRLTQGVKTLQVKDFRSFGSSFFAIRPAGENSQTDGKVWFGSLMYSGNWRADFFKSMGGDVQVTSGINFWDQDVNLKPGNSFSTPKWLVGFTENGMDGVSESLASFTREQVLPEKHRNSVRPVIYNSWYATTFNVNEEHQLALAKTAKDLGVELFVIDDGWFKGRLSDNAGLGDWTVDKTKFPDGLKPMIEKINAIGLDFGLWVEPEMVNPNSDLYRAHPDWVFYYPNRTRHTGRNQLMLNLAREDVYNYLSDCFHKILNENNIKYIKWDMNKSLSDAGFPSAKGDEQRSVRIRYVENLYRLIESLRKDFPDVWFENCASGGGRIDLGMMSRMDFNWISDNTDPLDRIFIQSAYLTAFPANTMVSWVTQQDFHQQNPSLNFKFDVAMAGVLGVGYDITKWKEEEKSLAKKKIEFYKQIRNTVQFGSQYQLVSPFQNNRSVLQYVNKDASESVIFVYNTNENPVNVSYDTRLSREVRLRGLNPGDVYKIDGIKGTFSGQFLMSKGIDFPLAGALKSRIFKVTRQ